MLWTKNPLKWLFPLFLSPVVCLIVNRYWDGQFSSLQVWLPIPVIMTLVFSYLVISPFFEQPLQMFYCVLFLVAGIPFYLVFVRYKVAPPSFLRFIGELAVSRIIALKVCQVTSTCTRTKIPSREETRQVKLEKWEKRGRYYTPLKLTIEIRHYMTSIKESKIGSKNRTQNYSVDSGEGTYFLFKLSGVSKNWRVAIEKSGFHSAMLFLASYFVIFPSSSEISFINMTLCFCFFQIA